MLFRMAHLVVPLLVAASLTAPATVCAQIAVLDSFDYADPAALASAGYQPLFATAPAVSTAFALNPTPTSQVSPTAIPTPVEAQTLLSLPDAATRLPLGGYASGDITLSTALLLHGYNSAASLSLLTPTGQGYLLEWNAGSPASDSGNGQLSLSRLTSFASLTPAATLLASAAAITPPTGYPLPDDLTTPLAYDTDAFFLGFSTLQLSFTAATGLLEVSQDGSPILSATDTTHSVFTHLALSSTNAGASFDNVILLAEVTIPEPAALSMLAPFAASLRRARR